ncbi:MAG: succinyl-diaminopimelate desuccinylase [Pseudomonadales bacterium]
MTDNAVLQLTKDLIAQPSVTPEDSNCQEMMISRLEPLGFKIERLKFGEVTNLWAVHGDSGPILAFAGHTDVVPTGPLENWQSPPFEPEIREGYLYGRGAADMKGSIAAMTVAAERFIKAHPAHSGRLAFLITSDEEGPAVDGTVKVIEYLQRQQEQIRWCVVGEPSSTDKLGDVIKNGRRGSLNGTLRIQGKQGHIAYPHLADNPIHSGCPALTELIAEQWDQGNDFFPATSFQISNMNAGTGATNIIPGTLEIVFNFRYSTEVTQEELQQRTEAILDKHQLNYQLDWQLSGLPFLTEPGELVIAAQTALKDVMGSEAQLSTSGGTSDGRFIAPTGAQVIELGPCNATIHQVNECVKVEDLEPTARIYQRIMTVLLTD